MRHWAARRAERPPEEAEAAGCGTAGRRSESLGEGIHCAARRPGRLYQDDIGRAVQAAAASSCCWANCAPCLGARRAEVSRSLLEGSKRARRRNARSYLRNERAAFPPSQCEISALAEVRPTLRKRRRRGKEMSVAVLMVLGSSYSWGDLRKSDIIYYIDIRDQFKALSSSRRRRRPKVAYSKQMSRK